MEVCPQSRTHLLAAQVIITLMSRTTPSESPTVAEPCELLTHHKVDLRIGMYMD